MAKTREQKQQAVDEIIQGIKDSRSTVFANFQGLKVREMEELRNKCRAQNVGCFVTKKTLLKRALDQLNMDVEPRSFSGGISVFLGRDDEVSPAQLVANFAKGHEVVKVFGGILEDKPIAAEKIMELSQLPSKDELLAKVVGSINAPVSGFVNVLAGNLRGLVNVLNAIKEAKV